MTRNLPHAAFQQEAKIVRTPSFLATFLGILGLALFCALLFAGLTIAGILLAAWASFAALRFFLGGRKKRRTTNRRLHRS